MRKIVTTLAVAAVLALPQVNAWAALVKSVAKNKVTVAWYTGPTVPCGPSNKWGDLQIKIKVQKTTTTVGTKKKVAIKILEVEYPKISDHTFKTRLHQRAGPAAPDGGAAGGPEPGRREHLGGDRHVDLLEEDARPALVQAKKPT